jgi:hypothetical protein
VGASVPADGGTLAEVVVGGDAVVSVRPDLDIGMKAPVPDLEDADLEIVALPSLRAWNSPRSRSTRRPGPISSAW